MKKYLIWGIVVLLIAFIAWKIFSPKTAEAPESYTASAGEVLSSISINATLTPVVYANIGAETLAEVTEVKASVGDEVKKGDVLATLDRSSLWQQVAAAKVAIERAETAEQYSHRKSSNSSKAQRLDLKKASEQARIGLQELYTLSSKGVLTSPIDGIVSIQNARVGEIVTGTTSRTAGVTAGTVIRVIDPSELEIEAFISESDIVSLSVGQAARMNFDAAPNKIFEAKISQIDPEATSIQDVIYFRTLFEITDDLTGVRPGMSGDIDIITAQADSALRIPLRFVRRDGASRYVYVLDTTANELAYKRADITTGIEGDDGFIEVVSGLDEGAEIFAVTEDVEK